MQSFESHIRFFTLKCRRACHRTKCVRLPLHDVQTLEFTPRNFFPRIGQRSIMNGKQITLDYLQAGAMDIPSIFHDRRGVYPAVVMCWPPDQTRETHFQTISRLQTKHPNLSSAKLPLPGNSCSTGSCSPAMQTFSLGLPEVVISRFQTDVGTGTCPH